MRKRLSVPAPRCTHRRAHIAGGTAEGNRRSQRARARRRRVPQQVGVQHSAVAKLVAVRANRVRDPNLSLLQPFELLANRTLPRTAGGYSWRVLRSAYSSEDSRWSERVLKLALVGGSRR